MKRLLDYDPNTGVREIFHYDKLTGDVHIETRQDGLQEMLDRNKALKNDDEYTKKGIKNEMWHYSWIPIEVQMRWLIKYGPENDPMKKGNAKLLFSLLNDREWCHLKTTNKIHIARE